MLSAEGGMITGDDTCFPQKGHNTVGVARQYCGNTGKIDNCQASPMVGYVSGKGYGIFDWRLYMPKAWFSDDHRVLRIKCKVPEQLSFETKNKMLLDMILSAHKSRKLRARYVGVDASYGSDSVFLDALPTRNWLAFHRYMLLSNMSHLFINKLRNLFSAKMHTPGATPYIDHPVPADEFLDAAIQLGKNEPITNAKIKAVPDRPQQVLTIGLIQKIVNAAFVKIGKLREEIDYQLMPSAAAFESHSRAKLNQALPKNWMKVDV